MKKIVWILILLILVIPVYSDNYALKIVNSDSLKLKNDILEISGSVKITIEKKDDKSDFRTLSCDNVVIDMDQQYLIASGNVLLTDGNEQKFQGETLYLDWDSLDVLVFEGTSETVRENGKGEDVDFYSSADTMSYSGESNVVFFDHGTISTTEQKYWSVKAGTIALLDSDLAFTNATVKIGHVPVLWVPFFFYPGTTIAFNPAVGFKSDKGMFLNTTTEIYGIYPKIGDKSAGSTEDTEDAIAASVFSFMKAKDNTKKVRDGIVYRTLEKEDQLTPLEEWARKTSSYLAVFIDAFEKNGISLGLETSNNLLDKKLKINALGNIAVNKGKFRYYLDSSVSYSLKNAKLSLKFPIMSDPDVAYDYLNRNTVFGLDSILGNEQKFPSSFSSGKNSYSWSLTGDYNTQIGNTTFKISSLNANVSYKWDSKEEKFKVQDAVLPGVSADLSGTLLKLSKEKNVDKSDEYEYLTEIGRQYSDKMHEYEEVEVDYSEAVIKPFEAPKLSNTSKVSDKYDILTITYNISEKLTNSFQNKLNEKDFSSTLSADLNIKGTAIPSWFDYSEKVSSNFSFVNNDSKSSKNDFKIASTLQLSSKELGLTYNFNVKFLSLTKTNGQKNSSPLKWDKEHITAHSLSFSKKFGSFSVGVKQTIKPLDMIMTPSVSYSENGLSISSNVEMNFEKDKFFKSGNFNFNINYSDKGFNTGISTKYDFAKEGWEGFKLSQNASYQPDSKKYSIKESLGLKENFKFDTLSISCDYKNEPLYFWKNRIGVEGKFNTNFTYDFANPYSSTLSSTATLTFAISEFMDLGLSITSSNNSFYKYYNNSNKFSMGSLLKDFGKSLLIFSPKNLKQTGFTINSFKLSFVHYMTDWNLYVDASAGITKDQGKYVWNPKTTVYIKWNFVPELKVENSWSSLKGWDK